MSKMSQMHAELTSRAAELGFESIEEAQANGYEVISDGIFADLVKTEDEQEQAHNAWLKEKEELLSKADKVWDNPNQEDLLELVDELVKFIKQGEM